MDIETEVSESITSLTTTTTTLYIRTGKNLAYRQLYNGKPERIIAYQ